MILLYNQPVLINKIKWDIKTKSKLSRKLNILIVQYIKPSCFCIRPDQTTAVLKQLPRWFNKVIQYYENKKNELFKIYM